METVKNEKNGKQKQSIESTKRTAGKKKRERWYQFQSNFDHFKKKSALI